MVERRLRLKRSHQLVKIVGDWPHGLSSPAAAVGLGRHGLAAGAALVATPFSLVAARYQSGEMHAS